MMEIYLNGFDGNAAILRMQRTEETKRIRRANKDKGMKFSKGHILVPVDDGVSNTITTVAKDNLLIVKQQ